MISAQDPASLTRDDLLVLVADPKPPGRQPGAGTFRYRKSLRSEEITEPPVEVQVLMDACPACGGALATERVDYA